MQFSKQRLVLVAAAAAAGAAVIAALAANTRRRRHRSIHDPEHTTELKSWENEGGNLAPKDLAPVLP